MDQLEVAARAVLQASQKKLQDKKSTDQDRPSSILLPTTSSTAATSTSITLSDIHPNKIYLLTNQLSLIASASQEQQQQEQEQLQQIQQQKPIQICNNSDAGSSDIRFIYSPQQYPTSLSTLDQSYLFKRKLKLASNNSIILPSTDNDDKEIIHATIPPNVSPPTQMIIAKSTVSLPSQRPPPLITSSITNCECLNNSLNTFIASSLSNRTTSSISTTSTPDSLFTISPTLIDKSIDITSTNAITTTVTTTTTTTATTTTTTTTSTATTNVIFINSSINSSTIKTIDSSNASSSNVLTPQSFSSINESISKTSLVKNYSNSHILANSVLTSNNNNNNDDGTNSGDGRSVIHNSPEPSQGIRETELQLLMAIGYSPDTCGYWRCKQPSCHFISTTNSVFLSHIRKAHSVHRPYRCEVEGCGAQFKEKYKLKVHAVVHTGEKPFACDWPGCNSRFSQSGHVSRHRKTHMGTTKYVCDWPGCDRSFIQKHTLKYHSMMHRGEKPWICDINECGRSFIEKWKLVKHQRSHDPNRQCPPNITKLIYQ